jgi:hypothetical protein
LPAHYAKVCTMDQKGSGFVHIALGALGGGQSECLLTLVGVLLGEAKVSASHLGWGSLGRGSSGCLVNLGAALWGRPLLILVKVNFSYF